MASTGKAGIIVAGEAEVKMDGSGRIVIEDAYVASCKNVEFEGDRNRKITYDEAIVVVGGKVHKLRAEPGFLKIAKTVTGSVTAKAGRNGECIFTLQV